MRPIGPLGGESDPGEFSAPPFSGLEAAVGVEDDGRFGAHLGKPAGHFVERTDEGYRLRYPGVRIAGRARTAPGRSASESNRTTAETVVARDSCERCR